MHHIHCITVSCKQSTKITTQTILQLQINSQHKLNQKTTFVLQKSPILCTKITQQQQFWSTNLPNKQGYMHIPLYYTHQYKRIKKKYHSKRMHHIHCIISELQTYHQNYLSKQYYFNSKLFHNIN